MVFPGDTLRLIRERHSGWMTLVHESGKRQPFVVTLSSQTSFWNPDSTRPPLKGSSEPYRSPVSGF